MPRVSVTTDNYRDALCYLAALAARREVPEHFEREKQKAMRAVSQTLKTAAAKLGIPAGADVGYLDDEAVFEWSDEEKSS